MDMYTAADLQFCTEHSRRARMSATLLSIVLLAVSCSVLVCVVFAGCVQGFASGKFILAHDSPLPKWVDPKTSSALRPFEITYTMCETTFTTTGKVTARIVSKKAKSTLVLNGTWQAMPVSESPLKEGEMSLVVMTFKGVEEIYEFRHLRDVIRIHSRDSGSGADKVDN